MTTSVQEDISPNGHGPKAPARLRPSVQVRDRLPVPRRPRRPLAVTAGVLVLAASAALGGTLALGNGKTVSVLTLARPVTAGVALTAADLSVAQLSGSGVHAIAAADANRVIGETTQADLPAGTLLTTSMLSASTSPSSGQQVVAVAVKPGAFPPELAAGGLVSVLQVAPANGGGLAPTVLVPSARVLRVEPDAQSGVTVVSLVVNDSRALAVAQASASGAVSLTLLPVSH